jgi:transposase
MAAYQKKAKKARATILFTDESGFLMTPLLRTTQAPAGHTPVMVQRGRSRQKVSIVAALCRSTSSGHVRLIHEPFVDQYVDSLLYAEFVHRLLGVLRGPLVLIHDGASLHRGDWIDDLVEQFPRIEVHELPPYSPELNPVEQLWSWTKDKNLANFIPQDLTELAIAVDHTMNMATVQQSRLHGFFDATPLRW